MTGPPNDDEIYRRLLLDELASDNAESRRSLRMWAWVFGLLIIAITTGVFWLFVLLLR
jgi:hypothetical protein